MTSRSQRTPVLLGDLIKVKHGWPFKSDCFSDELTGRPIVVSIGNFRYTGGFRFESTTVKEYRSDYPKEFELSPGDLLLVMTCQTAGGEILGIPGRIPDDGRIYLHNQRMGKVVITAPERARADYLYWLFLWQNFNRELVSTATGTKILHTAPSRIEAFKFEMPSTDEQRAIAEILGALDEKIDLNRRMNQTLESMTQALFRSWFVEFDPVRAKAEGRQPEGMDAETAKLFPSEFEKSPLGEIPKGWSISTIGEVATQIRDGVDPSEVPPETPYIGLEHMPQRSIALGDWGTAAQAQSQKARFRKGHILFGKLRPYFHKVGVAPVAGVCSTDIVVIEPRQVSFLGFTLGHISSDAFVAYTNAGSDGTRMPRTSWARMAAYQIVRPTPDCAAAFDATVRAMIDRLHSNLFESHVLGDLRDVLLPRLLSGEICLGDAERIVKASA